MAARGRPRPVAGRGCPLPVADPGRPRPPLAACGRSWPPVAACSLPWVLICCMCSVYRVACESVVVRGRPAKTLIVVVALTAQGSPHDVGGPFRCFAQSFLNSSKKVEIQKKMKISGGQNWSADRREMTLTNPLHRPSGCVVPTWCRPGADLVPYGAHLRRRRRRRRLTGVRNNPQMRNV